MSSSSSPNGNNDTTSTSQLKSVRQQRPDESRQQPAPPSPTNQAVDEFTLLKLDLFKDIQQAVKKVFDEHHSKDSSSSPPSISVSVTNTVSELPTFDAFLETVKQYHLEIDEDGSASVKLRSSSNIGSDGRIVDYATEDHPLGKMLHTWFKARFPLDENAMILNSGSFLGELGMLLGQFNLRSSTPFYALVSTLFQSLRPLEVAFELRMSDDLQYIASGWRKPFGESSFSCVWTSRTSRDDLNRRHVALHSSAHGFLQNECLVTTCREKWRYSAGAVFVIGGSSGSGKTTACFQAAKSRRSNSRGAKKGGEEDITIYLTPKDLRYRGRRWTDAGRRELANLQSAYYNASTTLSSSSSSSSSVPTNSHNVPALSNDDDHVDAVSAKAEKKKKRDEHVATVIEETIFYSHKDDGLFLSRLTPKSEQNQVECHVFIVFDEIGADRPFVRSLRSQAASLSHRFTEKLFGGTSMQQDSASTTRVHFIVAGTGLAIPDEKTGSMNRTATSFLLDKDNPLCLSKSSMKKFIRREFFKRPVISHLVELADTANELDMCERYGGDSGENNNKSGSDDEDNATSHTAKTPLPPVLQPQQKLVVDLCKNARCAALLFQYLDNWVEDHRRTSECSMSTFRDNILLGALSTVVERYISMNGLQDFAFPEKVLLVAVAVCEFRLPCLPSFESSSMKGVKSCLRLAREKNDDTYPDDLHQALVVAGGVLVDHLPDDQQEGHHLLENKVPGAGRYSVYAAHLAMVHVLFAIHQKESSSWSGWEDSVADFCHLSVFVSPLFVALKKALLNQWGLSFGDQMSHSSEIVVPPSSMETTTPVDQQEHRTEENVQSYSTSASQAARSVNAPFASPLAILLARGIKDSSEYDKTTEAFKHASNWLEFINNDPLFDIKEMLVFDAIGDCLDLEVSHCQVNNSLIQVVAHGGAKRYTFHEDCFEPIANHANAIRGKTERSVLVLRMKEMEPFADVVVVGPRKVVMIQCKALSGIGSLDSLNVENELNKLGITTSAPSAAQALYSRFAHLATSWFSPKDKRSSVSASGGSERGSQWDGAAARNTNNSSTEESTTNTTSTSGTTSSKTGSTTETAASTSSHTSSAALEEDAVVFAALLMCTSRDDALFDKAKRAGERWKNSRVRLLEATGVAAKLAYAVNGSGNKSVDHDMFPAYRFSYQAGKFTPRPLLTERVSSTMNRKKKSSKKITKKNSLIAR